MNQNLTTESVLAEIARRMNPDYKPDPVTFRVVIPPNDNRSGWHVDVEATSKEEALAKALSQYNVLVTAICRPALTKLPRYTTIVCLPTQVTE